MNQGHLRMIPLQTMIPVREDSEVVIIYPDIMVEFVDTYVLCFC
jgi:hypothetical protein